MDLNLSVQFSIPSSCGLLLQLLILQNANGQSGIRDTGPEWLLLIPLSLRGISLFIGVSEVSRSSCELINIPPTAVVDLLTTEGCCTICHRSTWSQSDPRDLGVTVSQEWLYQHSPGICHFHWCQSEFPKFKIIVSGQQFWSVKWYRSAKGFSVNIFVSRMKGKSFSPWKF